MTIKLVVTPPPSEGKASITQINLPSELSEGAWITGSIKAQNIGDGEDTLRILLTTQWDGKQYQGQGNVAVLGTLMVNIASGIIAMPDIDAVIKIEGQHLVDTDWVTDDTKTH